MAANLAGHGLAHHVNSYSRPTRYGNWNEELQAEQAKTFVPEPLSTTSASSWIKPTEMEDRTSRGAPPMPHAHEYKARLSGLPARLLMAHWGPAQRPDEVGFAQRTTDSHGKVRTGEYVSRDKAVCRSARASRPATTVRESSLIANTSMRELPKPETAKELDIFTRERSFTDGYSGFDPANSWVVRR